MVDGSWRNRDGEMMWSYFNKNIFVTRQSYHLARIQK